MLATLDNWLHVKYKNMTKQIRKRHYVRGGQIPLSKGYFDYRNDFLRDALRDTDVMARFRQMQQLAAGYGYRLDERVIEYPWVISRLRERATRLLDAGSTLNFEFLLSLPILGPKSIAIYTLAPEQNPALRNNVSYLYGDLRQTILKDHIFDEIVCISTLEHIGLDNTQLYTRDQRFNEARPFDYRDVLLEFQRVLAPGGRLFLTVPYGKYQNHGWLQQFDRSLLDDAIRTFDGTVETEMFYRYTPDGWVLSNARECVECEYYNFHARPKHDPDFAVAARAVACVELAR